MNNTLVIVPKTTRPSIPKPRKTTKSTNRNQNIDPLESSKQMPVSDVAKMQGRDGDEAMDLTTETEELKAKHEEQMRNANEQIATLKAENQSLKDKSEKDTLSIKSLKHDSRKLLAYRTMKHLKYCSIHSDKLLKN